MAFSRSSRIIMLLVIDTMFFFLEIIVGYSVHSLALVADSFHMLNDVFSLLVALWAIKMAKTKGDPNKYTYGWQRAEVLGALINGVFLIALCLSIVLEAIQRFFDPPTISNPVLILGVGIAGLISNILGLFLFHDHGHGGHSHGSHGHEGHKHTHGLEGHEHTDGETNPTDEDGDLESVMPSNIVRVQSASASNSENRARRASAGFSQSYASQSRHRHFASVDEGPILPVEQREALKARAQSTSGSESEDSDHDHAHPNESTSLLGGNGRSDGTNKMSNGTDQHAGHKHNEPKKAKSGGHSHENLNMRGVFLHVLGDALGNVGVILSAVFIWKTSFWWRFYADPMISLIITLIIFSSALPLCKSAAKILLQGVPNGISLEDVKADIGNVEGVVSIHELHIWQLSDTKMVASLHVRINFDPHNDSSSKSQNDSTNRYVVLAKAIRTCLHAYGIHSSTIQPEYWPSNGPLAQMDGYLTPNPISPHHAASTHGSTAPGSKTTSVKDACLMECAEDCEAGGCCDPVEATEETDDHHH